ncbi:MAG: serine/threonine-protein kinase, partial [Planctomycetota bacterium]
MSDAHFSNQRTDFAAADERLADAFDEVVDLLLTSPELEDQQILDRFPDRADALRELLPTLRTIASRPPTPGEPTPREPTPGEVAEVVEQGEPPTELKQLGEFLVHRKIGHGGMGVVYLAEQPSLNRRVALKVLGTASTLDARQLNRFKIEAQVAGSLHHPHIVPIYAVGDDRGVCYYAMQYIDGPSLAELLAALRADHAALDGGDSTGRSPADSRTPTEALQEEVSTARSNRPLEYFCRVAEWMAQAADGLAYAHENSVLHRDVKPGNLLLDRSGKLWITDFGLARLQSSSTMTATGDVIGTLRYMSPEQARVKPLLVDQRTDVYALGMTLYELLTLQPAFASDDRQELIRQIACNDPRPLRSIDPAIPVDLETVVLKAIEKEPRDRYLTAGELRDDLNRFLENRPVAAKRPALLDRAGKLVRRNRVASTAIAAALLIVAIASTLAAAVSLDAYREARVEQAKSDAATEAAQDSEQRALDALAAEQQALDMANTALYQSRMLLAKQAFADGYGSRVQSLLDACAPKEGETDRRSWEWRLLREGLRRTSQLVAPEAVGGSWLDWSRDGAMYLTSGGEQLRVWDASTHEEIRHWSIFLRLFREASFSPDGRRIAVGCADGSVRLLSLESDQQEILKTKAVQKLRAGDHPVDWSPDGKWIATGCGQQVTVIDVEKRATLAEAEYAGGLWCLAWSPDGEHVAFGGHGPAELDVLHVSSNATRTLCEPHGHDLWSLEWTRDGSRIVTGSFDRTVKLIDFASGETLATLQHPAGVAAARLSPDGKLIASATTGQQVMLWELETGKLLRSLPGALSRSSDLAW